MQKNIESIQLQSPPLYLRKSLSLFEIIPNQNSLLLSNSEQPMRPKPFSNLLSIFHHLCITSLVLIKLSTVTSSQPMNFKVGFIFDPDSPVGMIAKTTVPMALDDFYVAHPNSINHVSLVTRPSPGGDIITSASAG